MTTPEAHAHSKLAALPPAIFVTGTDTMVGKTFISAMLCKGLNAGYWKPVQSGIIDGMDTSWVREITALDDEHFYPEAYRLNQPLSPHLAAALDGITIEMAEITLPRYKQNNLIVEGAGGVLVPLNPRHLMIDLIEHLALPVIVVASSRLGTINHTLLTVNALRDRRINVLGVVVNGPPNPRNADAIVQYGKVPVIAQVHQIAPATTSSITAAFHTFFGEWYGRYSDRSPTSFASKPVPDLAPVHTNENSRASVTSQKW